MITPKQMKAEKSILEKLHAIEEDKTIYNIHYCNDGIGFCFYEPPDGFEMDCKANEWKKYLNTHHYYPTFEEAVEAEYKLLTPTKK